MRDERSLVDVLSPSAITAVTSTENYVKVKLGVEGDSDDRITVEVHRSIEDMRIFLPERVTVRWGGTGRNDVDYASIFANSLRQGVAVARRFERAIANPSWLICGPEDADQIQRGCVYGEPDYMLALFALLNGGEPFYQRGREVTENRDGGPGSRIVDLAGLQAVALGICMAHREMLASR